MEPHTFDDLVFEIMMEMEENGITEPTYWVLMHYVEKFPEIGDKLADFFATWAIQKFFVDHNGQQDDG